MDIRLLALDMDGTTLSSDHITISPANRAAIEAAAARGIVVVTATGRMRGRIPEQMAAIPGLRWAVTSNGAAVVDLETGGELYSNPIPHEAAERVLDALDGFPVVYEVYCNGTSYIPTALLPLVDTFPLPPERLVMIRKTCTAVEDVRAFVRRPDTVVEKFTLPFVPPDYQEALWSRLRALEGVSLTSSVPQNCEVNSLTANKADGLAHLCERLGILPAQVMAVGDNRNDLEMLQFAGLPVAPANASEEIRAVAKYITASNDEDGVAEAIQKFLLNPAQEL